MDETRLAQKFQHDRARLRAIARRMLGSSSEADDVVQEVWLRIAGHDVDEIRNVDGWFTSVTARICLDHLRARARRPEQPLDDADLRAESGDPEEAVVLADSVGVALFVVLETVSPAERLAFVLHDLFDVPFGEIATIVNRSPDAAKMLASRARRRIRTAGPTVAIDLARQQGVVDAFLAAARNGDMAALLNVLDPDATARADAVASRTGAPVEVRGAEAVAPQALSFAGRVAHARPVLVNETMGVAVARDGRLEVVLTFAIIDDRIAELGIVGDPEHLQHLRLTELDNDKPFDSDPMRGRSRANIG
jgi:RNA polymerase sigma-70 factor (ECF subfamily)